MALDLMSSFIEPISNDTTFFTTISEQNLPLLETLYAVDKLTQKSKT